MAAITEQLNQAKKYIENEDYESAISMLNELKLKDLTLQKEVDYYLGFSYCKTGKIDKSIRFFINATIDDRSDLAYKAYHNLASIYKRKTGVENQKKAFKFLVDAVKITENLDHPEKKTKTYEKFARYLIELDFFDAFENPQLNVDWETFKEKFPQIPEQKDGLTQLILAYIFYWNEHNFKRASQHLKNAIDAFREDTEMTLAISDIQNQMIRQVDVFKERKYLQDKIKQDQADLARLFEIGQAICAVLDLDRLLRLIVDNVIDILQAERGFLMLKDRKGELQFHIARNHKKEDLSQEDFVISQTIVKKVLDTGEPILLADIENEENFKKTSSIMKLQLKSAICVPLSVGDTMLGVIYMDNSIQRTNFQKRELNLLSTLASQASIAIENGSLWTDLKKEKKRLETLLECTKKMTETTDSLSAVNVAAHCIVENCPFDPEKKLTFYFNKQKDQYICYQYQDKKFKRCSALQESHPNLSYMKENIVEGNVLWIPIWYDSMQFGVLRLESGGKITLKREEEYFINNLIHSLSLILYKLKREKEKKVTLIGQMASTIIHDLKSPMTAIRGYSELISKKGELPIESRKHLDTIMQNVDWMGQMINNILEFSKGEITLTIEPHPVEAYMQAIMSEHFKKLKEKNIELEMNFEYKNLVNIDSYHFRRVVFNLVNNAIEAMDPGGKLSINVISKGDMVIFKFTDTGTGIPDDIQDSLFDPFVTQGKREGTGLGLAIVKYIIDEHNGKITFTSTPDEGTQFVIALPRQKSE
jgi:signal transduction histidine kinase/tetratricopeptide (TPR) repeat protein